MSELIIRSLELDKRYKVNATTISGNRDADIIVVRIRGSAVSPWMCVVGVTDTAVSAAGEEICKYDLQNPEFDPQKTIDEILFKFSRVAEEIENSEAKHVNNDRTTS